MFIGPIFFTVLRSSALKGWQNWAELEINLLVMGTEPRKERSYISVLGELSARMAAVFKLRAQIPDWVMNDL